MATLGKSISAEELKLMMGNKNPKVGEILERSAEQWLQRRKDVEFWVVENHHSGEVIENQNNTNNANLRS